MSDDPKQLPKREKRVTSSNPRLVREGMHELEPTILIERAREKLREATRELSSPPVSPKHA